MNDVVFVAFCIQSRFARRAFTLARLASRPSLLQLQTHGRGNELSTKRIVCVLLLSHINHRVQQSLPV